MKKIVILFILISNLLSAQSTVNLDLKNGFRHFKFGSNPSQIKNIVIQNDQYSKNPNVKTYDYVGDGITNVSNVKVETVKLNFFKNKLYSIGVQFVDADNPKDFELYDYNKILSALEQTYGKEWIVPSNPDGVITNGAIWDGKKVRLELLMIDFSKSKSNPKNYGSNDGYIHVFDKKLNDEMYSSEF